MASRQALLVNGGPRPRGNTAWLSSIVFDTLRASAVETKTVAAVSLRSVNNGCIGCEGCQRSREYRCVFKDDVQPVVASMPTYDYVIFATPVYFFGPSGQIKLVLDRMFSLLKSDRDGHYLHPFENRTKFGLIVVGGGDEKEGCDLTVEVFRRTAGIFGRPLETLVMPGAPLTPEERDDADDWRAKAGEFCRRLLGD